MGKSRAENTRLLVSKYPNNAYPEAKARKRFRTRAGTEPAMALRFARLYTKKDLVIFSG